MAQVIKITYQFKRAIADRWLEVNPILKAGEPGFEVDTGKFKIGNGIDEWKALQYIGDESIVVLNSIEDFPEVGSEEVIYRSSEDNVLYLWNSKTGKYDSVGSNSQELEDLKEQVDGLKEDVEQIKNMFDNDGKVLILYGGSATDNI